MAEEVKKTLKSRKLKAPKAQPVAVVSENVEKNTKKEEVKEIVPAEPVLSKEVTAEPEKEIVSVVSENVEKNIEEEEVKEIVPAEPVLSKEVTAEPEKEIVSVEEPTPEIAETELPEGTLTFAEYQENLEKSPVELKKLNPNLPDNKSKWVAQISYGTHSKHILFKGSYAKAAQATKNYNEAKGLDLSLKKN